jgi:hypothetical protein
MTIKSGFSKIAKLDNVNIVMAFAWIIPFILFNTPILNPVILSVDNQIDRLEKQLVSAENFDRGYISSFGRYGLNKIASLEAKGYKFAGTSTSDESIIIKQENELIIRKNIILLPEGSGKPDKELVNTIIKDYSNLCLNNLCYLLKLDLSVAGNLDQYLFFYEYNYCTNHIYQNDTIVI